MANLKGVNIPSTIVPFTTDDTYATHDSQYGKGGFRSCRTITERNSIPQARRSVGMLVYVIEEDITYKLNDHNQWEVYIGKGGGGRINWKTINDQGEIVDLDD
ncbi:MAG: hypothetical protein IJ193_08060 [Bacilli bacterium]|nr:hypothetical protein [Bacilli bacterium]